MAHDHLLKSYITMIGSKCFVIYLHNFFNNDKELKIQQAVNHSTMVDFNYIIHIVNMSVVFIMTVSNDILGNDVQHVS